MLSKLKKETKINKKTKLNYVKLKCVWNAQKGPTRFLREGVLYCKKSATVPIRIK